MSTLRYTHVESPIGPLLLMGSRRGLTGLHMKGGRHVPLLDRAWVDDPAPFREAIDQLQRYFEGRSMRFDLELDLEGTPFQRSVWQALLDIEYGSTISYKELATRIGKPQAMRAVGLANGRNPVSIIVPCHRVIGADGSLTGYGGGIERKRFLLDLESAVDRLL